jgi:nucleoside-diphosphate-sugar epimerase
MASSSTLTLPSSLVLPPGSLVLVTGATGFIASHVVAELLALGYRVRGTARSASKAATSSHTSHANHPSYSTAIVPDVAAPGAFDDAIRGVHGVIHVASDTSLEGDVKRVVGGMKAAVVGVLAAAKKEGTVKRVVLTSSSTAAGLPPQSGEEAAARWDEGTWNDTQVEQVYNMSEEEKAALPEGVFGFLCYAASKTAGERAAWEFVKREKPGFVLNTVLPNFNMGRALEGVNPGITGSAVRQAYDGKKEILGLFPPQWMVDVRDDARVHVAALLDGDVNGRRLYAFARPFNWNDVLGALRRVEPGKEFMADLDGQWSDETKVENGPAKELLKKWFGQEDWTPFDEIIKANIADLQ